MTVVTNGTLQGVGAGNLHNVLNKAIPCPFRRRPGWGAQIL